MSGQSQPALRSFIHRIDGEDRIFFVDDEWRRFAGENGLDPGRVLGTRIWQHISGDSARELTWYIVNKVRTTQDEARFPFRCDAPDRRRYMELVVSPLPQSGVEFLCRLLEETKRDPMKILDPLCRRTQDVINVCSWCKKVQISPASWLEAEGAVASKDLFDEPLPDILHVTCPACVATLSI